MCFFHHSIGVIVAVVVVNCISRHCLTRSRVDRNKYKRNGSGKILKRIGKRNIKRRAPTVYFMNVEEAVFPFRSRHHHHYNKAIVENASNNILAIENKEKESIHTF